MAEDINEVQKLIDQARVKYGELEQEFNKFNDLRADLETKAQGIRNFYSGAENKSASFDSLIAEIQGKKQEIEISRVKIDETKQEIDGYYQKFNELRTQLDDDSNGLEANFEWAKEKREEINKKYEEVLKIHTNSENLLKQLEDIKNEGEKVKQETAKLKEEVAKWLELISDSSRYNKFNERKKQLMIESYVWMGLVILGFLGLSIFIYEIFKNANGDFITSLNKSIYTTPIVFFLLWATKNYSDIRGYLERYSFKAILSVSLSSYLELLEGKFGKDCKELEKFSFESIRKIFIEPYKDKKTRQAINIFGGKVLLENSESPIRDELSEINLPEDNSKNNEI
jgi:uncharacterized coiled-coil DUF342 family protein